MNPNELYKPVSAEFDLGKEYPAFGTMKKWSKNDEWYFGIRFYYVSKHDDQLRPGKNGITVQVGYGVQLIEALIHTYNMATGNEYVLATIHDLKEDIDVEPEHDNPEPNEAGS